ncbi:MAG TPA: serine protease, partial [Planctomycetaceae bacterium]|nr:serine protease [Planctomycetaceae bacterium]
MRSCKPFHVFLLTAVGSALVIVCALCFIEFTSQGLAQQLAQQRQSAPLPESVQRANPPDSSQNAPPAENLTLHARWHELIPEERVNIMVYDKCNRSVANINTKITTNLLFGEIDTPGGGSGIVIDKAGHILTNFHVVEDATKVEVTLFNGKSYEAKKIGVDPITDIAVLKVDATPEELYPISFGDSTQLLVGQKIYAIGNP